MTAEVSATAYGATRELRFDIWLQGEREPAFFDV